VVNFDQSRGDQIVVESLPFDATLRSAPPEAPGAAPGAPPSASQDGRLWPPRREHLLMAAGAAALLLLAAGGLWLARGRKRSAAVEVSPALSAGAGAEVPSLEARMDQKLAEEAAMRQRLEAEAVASIRGPVVSTKKTEVLVKHLKETVSKDSSGMAQVLRTWMRK
jgi:flagellar M-ring protein FliF